MPFRSLNNNLLTGEIPDAFQALVGLINLYGLIVFCKIFPFHTYIIGCCLLIIDGAICLCAEIYPVTV